MNAVDSITEIVDMYRKHGWLLRRLLLTPVLKKQLDAVLGGLTEGVVIQDSDIDAAWFSRPPKAGGVAWEIRHLSDVPFALLEKADEFDYGFEETLAKVERRLAEATSKSNPLTKQAGHRQT